MKAWIVGVYALFSAGALQAQVIEPFAQVGDWQINVQDGNCGMMRLYPAVKGGPEEVLIVFYDAQRRTTTFNWGTRKPQFPPLSDSYDLRLKFLKGSSFKDTWGSPAFKVRKSQNGYVFTHVFTGASDSDRILHDLASEPAIVLFFGPALMTSLPLDASEAVTKLRECSARS